MKSAKCAECGFVGWSNGENCKACGAPFRERSHSLPPPAPVQDANYDQWEEGESPKKGMAIAALVLGILSFISFGLLGIGAIIGIVLACVAMSRANREPWKFGGHGIAIAGLVLSIVSLFSVVPMAIIASIAIPNLLASRRAANEASAIYSMRQIASAESIYYLQFQKYGTLNELMAQNLIDPQLASGSRHGYTFIFELTSGERGEGGFAVVGVPMTYGSTGRRSFYVDESNVVHFADNNGMAPSKLDPILGESDSYSGGRRTADYRTQPVY